MPIAIIDFYLGLLSANSARTVWLVVLGFCLRVSSVLIFALTVKAFLLVLDPASAFAFINNGLASTSLQLSEGGRLVELVIGGLAVLVLLQLALNSLYLRLFLARRRAVVSSIVAKPLSSNEKYNAHLCLDVIPQGFESAIKLAEIALFYAVLIVVVLSITPLVGLIVIALLFAILAFMYTFVNERINIRTSAFQSKQEAMQGGDLLQGLEFSDHVFKTNKRNQSFSEFLGGIGMVFVMLLYLVWVGKANEIENGVLALLLVLSIRFLINYTGEFSRMLGVLVNQNSALEKMDLYEGKSSMKKLSSSDAGA